MIIETFIHNKNNDFFGHDIIGHHLLATTSYSSYWTPRHLIIKTKERMGEEKKVLEFQF